MYVLSFTIQNTRVNIRFEKIIEFWLRELRVILLLHPLLIKAIHCLISFVSSSPSTSLFLVVVVIIFFCAICLAVFAQVLALHLLFRLLFSSCKKELKLTSYTRITQYSKTSLFFEVANYPTNMYE